MRLLTKDKCPRIFDSYTSLDVPIVRQATFCNIALIGGTAVQQWARAYGVKERRQRSINDLDFITTPFNELLFKFKETLVQYGFSCKGESQFMDFYSNDTVGVDVDILKTVDASIMDSMEKVNGVLCMLPVWLLTSKISRIVTGEQAKKQTDIDDILTLADVVVSRDEVDELEDYLSIETGGEGIDLFNEIMQSD